MLNADPVFVVLLSSVGGGQSARAAAGGGSGNRIQLWLGFLSGVFDISCFRSLCSLLLTVVQNQGRSLCCATEKVVLLLVSWCRPVTQDIRKTLFGLNHLISMRQDVPGARTESD